MTLVFAVPKLTGQSQTSQDISVQRVCVHPVQRRLWRWWNEPSSTSDRRSQSWSPHPDGGLYHHNTCGPFRTHTHTPISVDVQQWKDVSGKRYILHRKLTALWHKLSFLPDKGESRHSKKRRTSDCCYSGLSDRSVQWHATVNHSGLVYMMWRSRCFQWQAENSLSLIMVMV